MFQSSDSPSGRSTFQIQCHCSHECAAGSLWPCNPGRNYSVTVWIWLCQNSSNSQQANLQRPTQPSHRWLVQKNWYQRYCQDWNNPIYRRPSISHSSFLCSVQIWYQKSQFQPFSQLILQRDFCPKSTVCVLPLGEGQSIVTDLVFGLQVAWSFPCISVSMTRCRKFHSTTWLGSQIYFDHAKSISFVEDVLGSLS